MKLTRIRIKDFRSFSGDHEFEVSAGVNYFVGPNNCGKSNLVRALELALDQDARYDQEKDRPARAPSVGAPPTTRITLTFQVDGTSPEKTLLRYATEYELTLRKARNGSTGDKAQLYAQDSELRMVTSFTASGARQTTFQAKGFGAASLPSDSPEHQRLERQFRSVVRFGVIHSGEDLESLLKGKFHQILQLVIQDHLSEELARAEESRKKYVESLQTELLEPLRRKIEERVGGMFPEITVAQLLPDLPTVNQTLSSVGIQLGDVATTDLTEKGTGVRGAVLVSMLQYMAEQSRRSLVMAVEEPEAFLHPGAQEAIRTQLEDLARRADVSLIATTHSPYVVSRTPAALVTELRKGADGVSRKAASASGDEDRAQLLGSLYRDAGLSQVLERALRIPFGTRAVVVTEGYTDGLFLRIACEATGNGELLTGVHFMPAGSAAKVVPQAILTQGATDIPVIALLDYDDQGRAAADKLKSLNWDPRTSLLSLRQWPGACQNHDIEIEDLLPVAPLERLVRRMGEDAALDGKERCRGGWHFRTSKAWKQEAIEALAPLVGKSDLGGMIWLANELQERASRIGEAMATLPLRTAGNRGHRAHT